MSLPTRHPAGSGDINDLRSAIDCTYPWHLREHFVRTRFRDVDPTPWAPDLFRGPGR